MTSLILHFAFCILILSGISLIYELPGDYTYGETPVPIPNTEAKLVRPMVVLAGESRSSPGIYKGRLNKSSRPFPFRDNCNFLLRLY